MLLALVDLLRCPAPHEASTLVLAAEAWLEGRVTRGELGCPVCGARYPIRDGIADFSPHSGQVPAVMPGEGLLPVLYGAEGAVRLAAQLDLGDGGGVVLLAGTYANRAGPLADVVDVSRLLVDHHGPVPPGAVAIVAGDRLPLADGVLRGAAVDGGRVNALADVARVLRSGGRLVAPANAAVPPQVELIATDSTEWVGSVRAEPMIQLARSPRPA